MTLVLFLDTKKLEQGRQFYDLQESTRMVRVDTLERYDKKMLYVIDSVDGGCHKQQVSSFSSHSLSCIRGMRVLVLLPPSRAAM